MFGNVSAFYAARAEIRKAALWRILPNLPKLTARLLYDRPQPLDEESLRRTSEARLLAFRSLAEAQGTVIILVVPPTSSDKGRAGSWTIVEAGRRVGVPVLALAPGEVRSDQYSDGFHLNASGARLFTERLVPMLAGVLNRMRLDGSRQRGATSSAGL